MAIPVGDQTGTARSKAGTARFYSMAAVALSRSVTPVTPVTPARLARDQSGISAGLPPVSSDR